VHTTPQFFDLPQMMVTMLPFGRSLFLIEMSLIMGTTFLHPTAYPLTALAGIYVITLQKKKNKNNFWACNIMKLTNKQKANLFHLLALFPLIFIAVNDQYFKSVDRAIVKNILNMVIVAGIFYHLYLFMYVNAEKI
jgi:hypothetical protein